MTPSVDINVPLQLLENTTYASMSSAQDVVSLSWDPRELQEFFLLYAQNTEAASSKARNLVQAKIDSQLAVHYDQAPVFHDFVDPDEDYGTYSLDSFCAPAVVHTPSVVSTTKKAAKEVSRPPPKVVEPEPPKPVQPPMPVRRSRKEREMRKVALKKKLPSFVERTIAAFLAAKAEKPVAATEPSQPEDIKTIEVGKALTAAKTDEPVEIEIGLTESRVPAAVSTIQIARPSFFAVKQKRKSTFIGPKPLELSPSFFKKLQLDSSFWYNLSLAQRIERPLGFELVHTGLGVPASIDRSSNEFTSPKPSALPLVIAPKVSLAAKCMEEYMSVLKSTFVVPLKDTEPAKSSSPLLLIKPAPSKKTTRQRKRRTRCRKAKRAKKVILSTDFDSAAQLESPVNIDELEHSVVKLPEALESPSFEVPAPEISDEADSDRDLVEVIKISPYVEDKEVIEVSTLPPFIEESDEENSQELHPRPENVSYEDYVTKVRGLLYYEPTGYLEYNPMNPCLFYDYMNYLDKVKAEREAEQEERALADCLRRLKLLQEPDEEPNEYPSRNLQVGQLSQYHHFMKLVRDADQRMINQGVRCLVKNAHLFKHVTEIKAAEPKEVNNLQVGQLSHYHHFMKLLRESEHQRSIETQQKTNNLQVGQLSHYHYWMKLVKLSEYYHQCHKHLPKIRKAVLACHSFKPTTVVLSGVKIVWRQPRIVSVPQVQKLLTWEPTTDATKIEDLSDLSSPVSESSRLINSSESSLVSSPECKAIEPVVSVKPICLTKLAGDRKKNGRPTMMSNAKYRRERRKRAQRNREFPNATFVAPVLVRPFVLHTIMN